ncbi:hypothetical protein HK096_002176 [Nowakowskiella sp. JEL0078]|nr:hypothetical protein HK096_002176 [Nowakowskiella sp. JEL0078]
MDPHAMRRAQEEVTDPKILADARPRKSKHQSDSDDSLDRTSKRRRSQSRRWRSRSRSSSTDRRKDHYRGRDRHRSRSRGRYISYRDSRYRSRSPRDSRRLRHSSRTPVKRRESRSRVDKRTRSRDSRSLKKGRSQERVRQEDPKLKEIKKGFDKVIIDNSVVNPDHNTKLSDVKSKKESSAEKATSLGKSIAGMAKKIEVSDDSIETTLKTNDEVNAEGLNVKINVENK